MKIIGGMEVGGCHVETNMRLVPFHLGKTKVRAGHDQNLKIMRVWIMWVRAVHFSKRQCLSNKETLWGFPGGAVVKNPPANAGDTGLSPGLGRSHMPRSN